MNEWTLSNKISFFIISDKSCHVAQVVSFIPIAGIIYVYSLNLLCVSLISTIHFDRLASFCKGVEVQQTK